jgi:hypothetical protein
MRHESRLARIARRLIEGATVVEIAAEEGIGRTRATELANQSRNYMAEFLDDDRDELHTLYFRSLRVIEQAFSARKEYCTKSGVIFKGGPDHYARMAATKHLRDLASVGRPAPKHPEKDATKKRLTLPELEELLKANPQ